MVEILFVRTIKVCGVSDLATAETCAQLGFGAVGFVFYEKSPRNVTPEAVGAMSRLLPATMAKVGVFVDTPLNDVLRMAEQAGLTTLQLHGNEDVAFVRAAIQSGYHVVKVARSVEQACRLAKALPAETSLLLECGYGPLPGGNGEAWNWSEARALGISLGIAGGLNPENIRDAVAQSGAVAYDVSSGVESAPGVKDRNAIVRLAEAVAMLDAEPISFWQQRLINS